MRNSGYEREYNSNNDVVTKPMNDEVFLETNNDLQNEGKPRWEQCSEPSVEPRIEIVTPTSRKNMIKNHPSEKIIKSKEKHVITRRRFNE